MENQSIIMTRADIDTFIDAIATAHSCDRNEITYTFEPIIEDDVVSTEELRLEFKLESIIDDEAIKRTIHNIRVAIPEHLRGRAQSVVARANK